MDKRKRMTAITATPRTMRMSLHFCTYTLQPSIVMLVDVSVLQNALRPQILVRFLKQVYIDTCKELWVQVFRLCQAPSVPKVPLFEKPFAIPEEPVVVEKNYVSLLYRKEPLGLPHFERILTIVI